MMVTSTAVMTLSGDTRSGAAPLRAVNDDVALAAGGDQSAFERLYRTHVARIHSLTRRMLSTQEADEVTQDIFVRTWQKLGQFRGESAFSTWLHRLAVNVVIERRRSFAIQRERMTDDPLQVGEHRGARRAPGEVRLDFRALAGRQLVVQIVREPVGDVPMFEIHDATHANASATTSAPDAAGASTSRW